MRPKFVAPICVLAFMTACSPAPPEPHAHSKATLLLEQSGAKPGAQLRAGIQFETDKDWHIYWQNPGDSGEPPQIRWQLPDGATMGALQWPSPARMKTSAGTDYGYEGNVILLSTLSIPAKVQAGTNLAISGNVHWLVCHDTCIPQRAELRANVRISDVTTVEGRARILLATASERIPKPLPDGLSLTASSTHDNLQLSFASGSNIARAVFFPAEPEQVDNAAPQELANGGGIVRLNIKKSDHLQGAPERLKGVLVLNEHNSYQVDVPVGSSVAHKEKKR